MINLIIIFILSFFSEQSLLTNGPDHQIALLQKEIFDQRKELDFQKEILTEIQEELKTFNPEDNQWRHAELTATMRRIVSKIADMQTDIAKRIDTIRAIEIERSTGTRRQRSFNDSSSRDASYDANNDDDSKLGQTQPAPINPASRNNRRNDSSSHTKTDSVKKTPPQRTMPDRNYTRDPDVQPVRPPFSTEFAVAAKESKNNRDRRELKKVEEENRNHQSDDEEL